MADSELWWVVLETKGGGRMQLKYSELYQSEKVARKALEKARFWNGGKTFVLGRVNHVAE